jgi:hypothetical protein
MTSTMAIRGGALP